MFEDRVTRTVNRTRTRPIREILSDISNGKSVTFADKKLADIYNKNKRISKSNKR